MSFFNQKISLGSLFKRTVTESETAQFGRDARTDWKTLCFSFLLFTVCTVGVSVFVYAKINKGELFLMDNKKTPASLKMFDTFKLKQTIFYFGEKQARFETLKKKGISTTDPYIPKVSTRK